MGTALSKKRWKKARWQRLAHKKGAEPAEKTLYVGNTERALRALARLHRIKIDPIAVGVTGSVGKTTTREMIAAVGTAEIPYADDKRQPEQQHRYAANPAGADAGASGGGDRDGHDRIGGKIEELATTLLPQIGVITNIGVSHMEKLGSQQNIRRAKLENCPGTCGKDRPCCSTGMILCCGDTKIRISK